MAGQLFFPPGVVFDRVAVDDFVLAPMNAEVCLTVPVQIDLAQSDAAPDRLLVNSGRYGSPMPGDFAGEADVDRDEFHAIPRGASLSVRHFTPLREEDTLIALGHGCTGRERHCAALCILALDQNYPNDAMCARAYYLPRRRGSSRNRRMLGLD